MLYIGALSFLFLLFATWTVLYMLKKMTTTSRDKKITYGIGIGFVCVIVLVTLVMAGLSTFIAFPQQEDVERNGIKMVATLGEQQKYMLIIMRIKAHGFILLRF